MGLYDAGGCHDSGRLPAQAERASSLAPTTEVQETGEEQENQEPEEPAPEEGGEPQPAEDGKTGTPEEEPEIVVVEKATAAVMLDALGIRALRGSPPSRVNCCSMLPSSSRPPYRQDSTTWRLPNTRI